jgi:Domain of unknown function (DUF4956)
MNKLQEFIDRFTQSSEVVDIASVVVNLLIAAFLSFLISQVYIRFGTSISNRRMFASNFVLLACTTTLIITIVKSSLALSLGLVGALSIVRFRAAIKEPEELAFLFVTIAIGLGLGANQTLLTILSTGLIMGLVCFRGIRNRGQSASQNLYLNIVSNAAGALSLSRIVESLKTNCESVELRRFDDRPEGIEAAFLVELNDVSRLEATVADLRLVNESVQITFNDHRGIL